MIVDISVRHPRLSAISQSLDNRLQSPNVRNMKSIKNMTILRVLSQPNSFRSSWNRTAPLDPKLSSSSLISFLPTMIPSTRSIPSIKLVVISVHLSPLPYNVAMLKLSCLEWLIPARNVP